MAVHNLIGHWHFFYKYIATDPMLYALVYGHRGYRSVVWPGIRTNTGNTNQGVFRGRTYSTVCVTRTSGTAVTGARDIMIQKKHLDLRAKANVWHGSVHRTRAEDIEHNMIMILVPAAWRSDGTLA